MIYRPFSTFELHVTLDVDHIAVPVGLVHSRLLDAVIVQSGAIFESCSR